MTALIINDKPSAKMNFSKALGGLSGQLPNHEYYILENLGTTY